MIDKFRDHAANERTFLAWVRTVIGIIGFGLVAARLGSDKAAFWSEASMLGAGGVVLVLAYLRMRHIKRNIASKDNVEDDTLVADALLLLLIVFLFGLLGAFALHVSQ